MLRLLSRLAIDPSLRQAALAKNFGVTRSAINQIWNRLETQHQMKIKGTPDYGKIGFQLLFGWAISGAEGHKLSKFSEWLRRNPFCTIINESLITPSMDTRILFEAILPSGKDSGNFLRTLAAFRKRPYSLTMHHDFALQIGNHLNLGLLDEDSWSFDSGFRFEVSIGAVRDYAEILPVGRSMKQSPPLSISILDAIIASALETDFFATSTDLHIMLKRFGLDSPSERTLRRKIASIRESVVQPYLWLEQIGLENRLIVTLLEPNTSSIYKLLLAQASTFPKARVLSGRESLVLVIDIPSSTDWIQVSNAISKVVGYDSEICTFIAEEIPDRKWFENIMHHILMRKSMA